MRVKTVEGDGGFNGDIGSIVKAGGFTAIAYGNKKDTTTKSEYDTDLIFKKFAGGAIARTPKKLVPSGNIPL